MELILSKENVFIPSFNRNKDLPETDQISVRYRVPTMAIRSRCRSKPQAKAKASPTGGVDHIEITIEKDDIKTLNEMLISISKCSYKCDGKEHKITNAQTLIDAPIQFEKLYKEILEEFNDALDNAEISEKN